MPRLPVPATGDDDGNGTSNDPPSDTSMVRWKPVVFEPSTTVFLMVWSSVYVLDLSADAIVSAVLLASGSRQCGGSSSCSTRQLLL